jgi:hypothetical protein
MCCYSSLSMRSVRVLVGYVCMKRELWSCTWYGYTKPAVQVLNTDSSSSRLTDLDPTAEQIRAKDTSWHQALRRQRHHELVQAATQHLLPINYYKSTPY